MVLVIMIFIAYILWGDYQEWFSKVNINSQLKQTTNLMNVIGPDGPNHCSRCNKSSTLSISPRIGYKKKPTCDIIRRSTLANAEAKKCGRNIKGNAYKLLITCSGRSGSTFVAAFLNRIGIHIGHDQETSPWGNGAVAWPMLFNMDVFDSLNPSGENQHPKQCLYKTTSHNKKFRTILHLVRHPLKSIRSRWDTGNFKMTQQFFGWYKSTICNTDLWRNWPEKYPFRTPKDSTKPDHLSLVATLRHWVLWNTYASSISEKGYQLEHFVDPHYKADIIHDICTRASIEDCPSKEKINKSKILKTYSTHTKKVFEWDFTWEALFAVDPEYAILAQLMSIRYGYSIKVGDLYQPLFNYFCAGNKTDLDKDHSLVNLNSTKSIKSVECIFLDEENIIQPDCNIDPVSNLWGCNLPKKIKYNPADFPPPHFPFDTSIAYKALRKTAPPKASPTSN